MADDMTVQSSTRPGRGPADDVPIAREGGPFDDDADDEDYTRWLPATDWRPPPKP